MQSFKQDHSLGIKVNFIGEAGQVVSFLVVAVSITDDEFTAFFEFEQFVSDLF